MSRNISSILAQQYTHEAYQRYGQYVVGNRAVADYRDGLKPVQRRILWAMHKMGLHDGKPYTKSANTVGTVLAHYHPHGDSSVYDALVGLATCRYPLVDGQGNFGSPDGDKAAAYRYTESRLHRLTRHVVGSDDSILEMQPNFDDRFKEPIVMAAELPVLLLNGCSGIAVGIASEIPPHNLREIVGACIEVVRNPKAKIDDILGHVQGPDYGSGVLTSTPDQVREVYERGEGQLSFRCLYELTANELVITQYAPRFSLNKFIETCERYVEAGNLQSVTNKSSKKTGTRIVVAFTNPRFIHDHVIPMLETSISFRFFVNETSADDGAQTMQLGLVELLRRWVAFRIKTEKQIIGAEIARLDEQIIRADARRLGAINLQKVARIVSSGADDLEHALAEALQVTLHVARIILDLPLRSLAKTQVEKVEQEIAGLKKQQKAEQTKLKQIDQTVIDKLKQAMDLFGDDRGMQVRVKRPKLELPADDEVQTWLACNRESGKVLRLEDSPETRRGSMQQWDQLIQTGPFFWVVLASGQMHRVDVASLVVGKPKSFGEIAGIVSSAAQRIVVMDETGEGLVIDAGALVKDKYQSMKTQEKVIRAVGMKDTSCLFAWNVKKIYCHKPEKLQTTRVNSSGWKLLPKTSTNGAQEILVARAVDAVLSIWDGKLNYGQCNAPPTEGATAGRCYVEWDDGTKNVTLAKNVQGLANGRKVVKLLGVG